MNYNYTQNIKSLLEISWNEFQMEPGYLKKEKLVEITKEEIIFKLDESGIPLNNGLKKTSICKYNWTSYAFGEHLDQNLISLSKFKSFKSNPEYIIPAYLNSFIEIHLEKVKGLSDNVPLRIRNEFLDEQLDILQNIFLEATPQEHLEGLVIAYISNRFETFFKKERTENAQLDIASKKININLNKNDISILFGLLFNSNILKPEDRQRVAHIIENEFCTNKEGKGNKNNRPLKLTNMDKALYSSTSKLRRKDTSALNTKETILTLLRRE